METYTSGQIASIFSVHDETIRRWSKEFADYMSIAAEPGKGHTRLYNADDLRVLALIADLKAQRQSFQNIHAALANGERGEPPEPPQEDKSIVPAVHRLQLQIEVLRDELDVLRTENADLKQQLALVKAETALAVAQREIELQREIGRLEGELEYRRKQDA